MVKIAKASPAPKWDERTLLEVMGKLSLVQSMNPTPHLGDVMTSQRVADYDAGWDDGLQVGINLIGKLLEMR